MASSSVSICRFDDADAPSVQKSGSPDVRKSGRIVCSAVGGQSALTVVEGGDPLKLIPVRGRGTSCTVCVATYGGGFLAGDEVALDVVVETDARLVLTTQANGKVYRSDDGTTAHNTVDVHVADGGTLVVLPDPVTPFAGSRFQQAQRIDLDPAGNLVALDWLTAGRIARGEAWQFTSFSSRLRIDRAGEPWIIEHLGLDPGLPARWPEMTCLGSCVITGPDLVEVIAAVDAAVLDQPVRRGELVVTSSPVGGARVLRFAAVRSEIIQDWLRTVCAPLTAQLGNDPWAGRH